MRWGQQAAREEGVRMTQGQESRVTIHESRDEDEDEETGDTSETKKRRMKM
jgi:hypothetical protein